MRSVQCTMRSQSASGKIGDLFLIPTPFPSGSCALTGYRSARRFISTDTLTDRGGPADRFMSADDASTALTSPAAEAARIR